jgi:NAD+ diphosphatase
MAKDSSILSAKSALGGAAGAYWFVVLRHKLLVAMDTDTAAIPFGEGLDQWGLIALRQQYLGTLRGFPCHCVEVGDKTPPPEGMAFEGLRLLYGLLEEDAFKVALRAMHLVEWDRTSRFCGRCGARTEPRGEERAKQCTGCGTLIFPRISPAVIVLIERGDQVLLARAARFPESLYSVLAGFVEPGESLEETVHREIEEETGILVKDVRYFGSQPWPFPDSLMVGFTARYKSGEIRVDGKEILDARWFSVDDLPQIPGRVSIARKLIDRFIEKHQATKKATPS